MKFFRRIKGWADAWSWSQLFFLVLVIGAYSLVCAYQSRLLHRLADQIQRGQP